MKSYSFIKNKKEEEKSSFGLLFRGTGEQQIQFLGSIEST